MRTNRALGQYNKTPIDRRGVQIDTVDIVNSRCNVIDKTGGHFICTFRNTDAVSQIPNQGETWIAERIATHEWHLVSRYNLVTEQQQKQEMSPGDVFVRAPGAIHMRGESISVSSKGSVSGSKPLGATRWERMVTSGSTTSWALTEAPVDIQTVQFFNNGTLVDPSTLSLTGTPANVLHFASIATGNTLIVYYQTV